MSLLAPSVVGPLTPLSSAVVVDKVLPGSVVQVRVNGNPFGSPASTSGYSVSIPWGGNNLPPHAVITATWSLGGEVSPPSLPVVVAGWPEKALPAPRFSSPIHTEMDWVGVEGLYPGATVEVFGPAGPVGPPQICVGPDLRFQVDAVVSTNDELVVVQKVKTPAGQTFSSDKGQGLPAVSWYPREGTPPVPVVHTPIADCSAGVTVSGLVVGTMFVLTIDGHEVSYPASGDSVYALLGDRAHAPSTYSARTEFRRVHRQSGMSTPVGVDPAAGLRTPRLVVATQACPSQGAFQAEDLTPSCELVVELHTGSTVTVLGRGGTPAEGTSTAVVLPDLSSLIAQTPPHSFLIIRETQCALTAESAPAYLAPWTTVLQFPPAITPAPTACSMWLRVNGVYGALVVAHSTETDWPVLCSPTLLPTADGNTWLHLDRPLRDGEKVWVELVSGCVPDGLRVSDQVPVGAVPDLDAIVVRAPNYPMANAAVWVDKAVSGATVHVFVGDEWRTSGVWLWDYTRFPVGPLRPEQRITARQQMCGRLGQVSPPEAVMFGVVDLESSVGSVVRGTTVTLTITAREPANGTFRGGWPISLGGSVVGTTGSSMTIAVPAAAPGALVFTVAHEGFTTATLSLPVTNPAPPPPVLLTVNLEVALGLTAQAINSVTWTALGPGGQLTATDSPNTVSSSAAITLPPPAGGLAVYQLSGEAKISYTHPVTRVLTSQTVTNFLAAGGLLGSLTIEWKGVARAAKINIGYQEAFGFYFVLESLNG